MDEQRSTVAVTGSGGLLGRRICRALLRDHRVLGLDLKPPPDDGVGEEWIDVDLTDDTSVRDALERVRQQSGGRLASVVHLAAYYDFSGEPSPLYEQLTVKGTERLLKGLHGGGLRAEQFVFSSSVLAMRPAEEGLLLDESSPEFAEWDYPQSKLDAERVVREEHGDIPAVVLRIAGCYDEHCHSIPIGQQIKRIAERQLESRFFPGDPHHGQAFVHVDDVADLVCRVVERRAELSPYELLLVAEPAWLSYAELQDRLGELLHGHQWTTLRVPAPVAKAGAWVQEKLRGDTFIKPWMIDLADAHYPVDIAKARRLLDWEPSHRLADTLPAMVARLQADPDAFYEENGLQPSRHERTGRRRPGHAAHEDGR